MTARGGSITKLLFGASGPAADKLSEVTSRHEEDFLARNANCVNLAYGVYLLHLELILTRGDVSYEPADVQCG